MIQKLKTASFKLGLLMSTVLLAAGLQLATATALPGETIYNGTNTGLSGDDDDTSVPIGFAFNFYGTDYTNAFVNINGEMTFASGSSEYSNNALPDASEGPAVMPFWDDIITQDFSASSIYYRTIGTAPNREFIVQWTNMYFYSDPSLPMGTFQAILHEGSNKVQFQYRDLLGGSHSQGDSATIGINKDGSVAQQVSLNTASLSQGQAISLIPAGGDTYTVNTNATYDLVYLSDPAAPDPPQLSSPGNDAPAASVSPTFTWQAADQADSYQLLVATDSNFSNIVINESGLTDTHFTPSSSLSNNTRYYWKVGAVNNVSSALSDTWSFTTEPTDDHDGVTAAVEAMAPNSGDANNDGTPDDQQVNVTSLVDPETNKYVVLDADGCTDGNTAVSAAANTGNDAGYDYPAGLLSFTLGCAAPGTTATVTQYFYGVDPTGLVLRKYNPTTHVYTTVTGAALSSVTIGGQQATKVVYSITDGDALDQDGTVNGSIIDPVGLASKSTATTSVNAPNTGYGAPASKVLPIGLVLFGAVGLAVASFGYIKRQLHR